MKKQAKINDTKSFIVQVSNISRIERWKIYYRLQELNISCWCLEDGTLWVEINDCIKAILLYSIVKHFIYNRLQLINWLNQCLSISIRSKL